MAGALVVKQSAFSVLVVNSGDGIVDSVKAALTKSGAKVQVTVTTPNEKPQGEFSAVIISGSLAAEGAPEWIRSFGGMTGGAVRIIVQSEASGLVWAEDAAQAG